MKIIFDKHANEDNRITRTVSDFLVKVSPLEVLQNVPITVYQDGANASYYIKCSLLAADAASICDLGARLDISSLDSYKANRQLLLQNNT